jgi:hypothetical protein
MTAVSYVLQWGADTTPTPVEVPAFIAPVPGEEHLDAIEELCKNHGTNHLISHEVNGNGVWHTHIVIIPLDTTLKILGNITRKLRDIGKRAGGGRVRLLKKEDRQGRTQFVNLRTMFVNYFGMKVQMTNRTDAFVNGQRTFHQMRFSEGFEDMDDTDEIDAKEYRTEAACQMQSDTDTLIKRGWCTPQAFRKGNREFYFKCLAKGKGYLENILKEARNIIVEDYTLQRWMVDAKQVPSGLDWVDPPENIITQVLKFQAYDPAYFWACIYRWSGLENGKRNTIVLWGDASTGKSLIHNAIKSCSPITGTVMKNSDNFPWNNCVDCSLISWDEGCMTETIVETAKEVCGGEACDVDQKGTHCRTLPPTPVFMTSNTDPTYVQGPNSISAAYREPLLLRMITWNFRRQITFGNAPFERGYPEPDELKKAVIEGVSWGARYHKEMNFPITTHMPPDYGDKSMATRCLAKRGT